MYAKTNSPKEPHGRTLPFALHLSSLPSRPSANSLLSFTPNREISRRKPLISRFCTTLHVNQKKFPPFSSRPSGLGPCVDFPAQVPDFIVFHRQKRKSTIVIRVFFPSAPSTKSAVPSSFSASKLSSPFPPFPPVQSQLASASAKRPKSTSRQINAAICSYMQLYADKCR